MGESSQRIVRLSSFSKGTSVPKNSANDPGSKFGTVVRALWPDKPAVCLSQLVGCSERHANLLINGHRKPNARVAWAVLGEIIT